MQIASSTSSLQGLGASLASRDASALAAAGNSNNHKAESANFASLLLSEKAGAPRPPGPPPASMPVLKPQPQAQAPTAQKPASATRPPASPAHAATAAPKRPADARPDPADNPLPDAGQPLAANANATADDTSRNSRVALRSPTAAAASGDAEDATTAAADAAVAEDGPAGKATRKDDPAARHAAGSGAVLPDTPPAAPPLPAAVGGTAQAGRDDSRDAAGDRPGRGADPADGGIGMGIGRAPPSFAEAAAASRERDSLAAIRGGAAADATASAGTPASGSPSDGGFAALLAEQQVAGGNESRRASSVDDTASTVGTGAAAFGAAGAPSIGPASAAHPVDLPAAVGSPDFARQLGLQVSVLARDGIQQAELHLNPVDMGPVSVQITMDGNQARVDFGADVAATRHAIEAGLPALASALADAGFTLAGGGVSQHAAGGGGGGGGNNNGGNGDAGRSSSGNAGARSAAIDPTGVAARGLRRTVSVGGVDLYA